MMAGSHWFEFEGEGQPFNARVMGRLLAYTRPYRAQMVAAVLCLLAYTGATVALPWIIRVAVDSIVATRSLRGLGVAAVWFAALVGVAHLMQYLHLYLLALIGRRVLYDLRTVLFDHLQRLSLSFFDRTQSGRVMSRVQNDVEQLQEFLSITILGIGDLLTLLGIIGAMLLMDWRLGLASMVVVPALFVVMLVWQRHAQASFLRTRRTIATVNGNLHENISGMRVIQSLNRQAQNAEHFDRLNRDNLDANLSSARLAASLMPVVEVLTAVATGLVVLVGGLRVAQGSMEIGVVVAFALYVQRFFDPVRNLIMQYNYMQRAMTAGTHIFELLDERPGVEDRQTAQDAPEVRGEVEFRNVTFEYLSGQPVLRDVDLHIRAGETVALVGPTGAGKTTIAALALRFYDPTRGAVLLDGHDLRDLTMDSVARRRALVPQEPFLFSGSIADNIRYARTGLSDGDVRRAAEVAGVDEFVRRLPEGYASDVGERGVNLSQGQRQLIALARAVATDPRVIVLDEATASVDSHTEAVLQEALRRTLAGRTAVVIAHRLSTVRTADRILVVLDGRIVEEGRHGELMRRGGAYARLYSAQFERTGAG